MSMRITGRTATPSAVFAVGIPKTPTSWPPTLSCGAVNKHFRQCALRLPWRPDLAVTVRRGLPPPEAIGPHTREPNPACVYPRRRRESRPFKAGRMSTQTYLSLIPRHPHPAMRDRSDPAAYAAELIDRVATSRRRYCENSVKFQPKIYGF